MASGGEHDLVIRNGLLADGTGAPLREADVALRGGTVSEVGTVAGRGREEIDAAGALVAPGWVDVHTHYDGQATWDEHLFPSSAQGVTTVVFGNCGVGFAPVRPADRDRLVALMEGVEDIPGTALHEGLPWDWTGFPEYLDSLERRRRDIDCAAYVPHGALRVHAMGPRAVPGSRPPTTTSPPWPPWRTAPWPPAPSASPPPARSTTAPAPARRHRASRPRRPSWPASPPVWPPPVGASSRWSPISSTSTRSGRCCGTWPPRRGGRSRSRWPRSPTGRPITSPSSTASPPPTPKAWRSAPRSPRGPSGCCSACPARCTRS